MVCSVKWLIDKNEGYTMALMLPRRIDIKDLGEPGALLSRKEIAWLNNYMREYPNHPSKISMPLSQNNLKYTVIINEKNRYALYKGMNGKALGKGGFGKVKIGQNIDTGEWVSVKIQVFTKKDKSREKEIKRECEFSKEVGLLKDVIETKTKHIKKIYIVQKLIGRGDDLFHHFFYADEKTKISTFDEKLDIAIFALEELKTKFHDKNILHRDVKPDNIVYDKANRKVMLIDFGAVLDLNKVPKRCLHHLTDFKKMGDKFFAKKIQQKNRYIDNNTYYFHKVGFGTDGYMAPEIDDLKEALYSKSSDIYAMGICLYYLITVNKKNEKRAIPYTLQFYNLVAKMCNYDPRTRPTVEQALKVLYQMKRDWKNKTKIIKTKNTISRTKTTHNKNTTLLSAVKEGDLNIIKLLLKKNDVNNQDAFGNTPLIYATLKNHINVLKLLLNDKRTNLNIKNKKGFTALMVAVHNNNVEAIISLLVDKRIDLEVNQCLFSLIQSKAIKKLIDHLVKLKFD